MDLVYIQTLGLYFSNLVLFNFAQQYEALNSLLAAFIAEAALTNLMGWPLSVPELGKSPCVCVNLDQPSTANRSSMIF